MKKKNPIFLLSMLCLSLVVLPGCDGQAVAGPSGAQKIARSPSKDILIYAGDSTAYGDPEAILEIAEAHDLKAETVSSTELDAMSLDQLADYGAIVWPGGYAGQMSSSLNRSTRDRVRAAVRERGVGFVGFCAGAFIAVSPDTTWGLSLVVEETLPYYFLEDEGIDSSMVRVDLLDESRQLVWWGGPKLPEWPKGIIARYNADGSVAIGQTWAGNGLVVLAGPHPEAPQDWRDKLSLSDSDGLDQELAWKMIEGALKGQPLPTLD
jgi:hypothetical protein